MPAPSAPSESPTPAEPSRPGQDAAGGAGHTPGLWRVFEGDGVLSVHDSEHKLGGHMPVVHWMGFDGTDRPQDENIANARLIAAAPELLEACEEFVRKVDAGEARSKRSYAQMKAAIAKARGQCGEAFTSDEGAQ